ncbi:pentapeptide repeat-containing protein [uncultured Desulfobacter sp.]|uniref:pentapeptide repeat-containing protein n=1 Tax=uncultured Desulfobacter sp. TaxID=240139 RepID=UPI0029C83F26|nr:pentapeptide repeat-containing protein [uncultured Desulfobacter sp.]
MESILSFIVDETKIFGLQIIFGFIFLLFSLLLFFLYKNHGEVPLFNKNEKKWKRIKNFYYYSGMEFILRKFVPNKDNKNVLPTGFIWLLGLYFAAFAFASQRYEDKLNEIEYKYNIFTAQIAGKGRFVNSELSLILDSQLPYKPNFWLPPTVINSFCFPFIQQRFYETGYIAYSYRTAPELMYSGLKISQRDKVNYSILQRWKHSLDNCYLVKSKFPEIYLDYASLQKAQLCETNFQGAFLTQVNFRGAILCKAKLQDATLNHANFEEASLQGANLQDATLKYANFKEASLNGANLQSAYLRGVKNLTAEQLIKADNIYNIHDCPEKIRDKIRKYNCSQMFKKKPAEWSWRLKSKRNSLIVKWANEPNGF